jgi:lipoyl synthase
MKEQIRVSMGTLRVLGMEILETDADPTTAYLQTYEPGRCSANCAFCSQARDSKSKDENIARGLYPPRDTKDVIARLSKAYAKGLLKRACIQTMNYPGMAQDLLYIVEEIRKGSDIPISISIFPVPEDVLRKLKAAGASQVVIPLDAVTKDIFEEIKGRKAHSPYQWETHLKALSDAANLFGKGNVGTHLIIGLGETEEEAAYLIQMLTYMGVYPALFAYTQVPGSQMKRDPPNIRHYRRIQLISHLISNKLATYSSMEFSGEKVVSYSKEPGALLGMIDTGEPFRTKGCADCNRPYSTEGPGGVIYNYPRPLTDEETDQIRKELGEEL